MYEISSIDRPRNIYRVKFFESLGKRGIIRCLSDVFSRFDHSRHYGLIFDIRQTLVDVSSQEMFEISEKANSELADERIIHTAVIVDEDLNEQLARTYQAIRKSSHHEVIQVFKNEMLGIEWLESELDFYL